MSEWKMAKIEDLLLIPCRNGLTKPSRIRGNGVKMIAMGELFAHPIIYDIEMDRVPVTEKEFQSSNIEVNDLLFARQSLSLEGAGKCSIVKEVIEPTVFESHLIRLRINNKIADPWYVYYYFNSYYGKHSIQNIVNQVAAAGIKGSDLVKLEISLPSLEKQKIISAQLSEIDSKIECNRKICANLEAQAQALFKHWFIDFAPFKNGKFVESDLGMIPEGWRVGTYNEIIQETISGDWGKDKPEGNYTHKVACIRGCDFQDVKMGLRGKTPERYILEKNFQAKHFEDKDILVEISGGTATVSTGRVCPISQSLIDKYNGDIVCTNFCRLVRPCKGYSSYLYYSWKYKYDHKVMFGYENGTSGIKNFSIKDFSTREPLILPDLSALTEFESIIEQIHTQIQNCGSESAKLATLRDTLLPKLMSGQIKV